jgi:AraC-like DNA-binding protein
MIVEACTGISRKPIMPSVTSSGGRFGLFARSDALGDDPCVARWGGAAAEVDQQIDQVRAARDERRLAPGGGARALRGDEGLEIGDEADHVGVATLSQYTPWGGSSSAVSVCSRPVLRSRRAVTGGLLSEVRRDLAQRYLRDERIAICEVGFLLGFQDVTAFHRAFKR